MSSMQEENKAELKIKPSMVQEKNIEWDNLKLWSYAEIHLFIIFKLGTTCSS